MTMTDLILLEEVKKLAYASYEHVDIEENEKDIMMYLEKFLISRNISKEYFTLCGCKESTFCLMKIDKKWVTFYQDGNNRTSLREFGNCPNACINLVNRFKSMIDDEDIDELTNVMKEELREEKRTIRRRNFQEVKTYVEIKKIDNSWKEHKKIIKSKRGGKYERI